jgi:uncharacterized protein YukE
VSTRPQGTPYRLREMAGGFATGASNIRARVAELEHAGAGTPASWGWSGAAAAAYSRTWLSWRSAAQALADRMDSSGRGAAEVLNQLADELEQAQRAYDHAVSTAQALGLSVDARGYVAPRSVASPAPLPVGTPEQQVEAELASAARLGQQALHWAGEQLHAIFDKGWIETFGKLNDILGWPTTPITLLQTGTTVSAGVKLIQSSRQLPGLAARLFSEEVGPTALAFDRGEATFAELEQSAWVGLNRIEAARGLTVGADRATFLRSGASAGGTLDLLGRVSLPFAVFGDVATLINPGEGGAGEQAANRVAAGANLVGVAAVGGGMLADGGATALAVLGVDAAFGWVPVAGQILVVATGLFLAADWAYNNVKPFHDFVNTAASDTVQVAENAWNGATNKVSDISNGVKSAFGGATHVLSGFFHWP